MKKVLIFGVIISVLGSFGSFADPINITVDSSGNPLNGNGTANTVQYGFGDNDPSSNLSFLQTEIGNWNGAHLSPTLPADPTLAFNEENLSGDTFTAPTGYDYVVFHFSGPVSSFRNTPVGAGDSWEAVYLGDQGGTFTVPSSGDFSSARFFDAPTSGVPDGGSTLALFGMGLAAVVGVRKKLAQA